MIEKFEVTDLVLAADYIKGKLINIFVFSRSRHSGFDIIVDTNYDIHNIENVVILGPLSMFMPKPKYKIGRRKIKKIIRSYSFLKNIYTEKIPNFNEFFKEDKELNNQLYSDNLFMIDIRDCDKGDW